MKNRELLIEILLKLRSIGFKNYSILEAIERIPPHYYIDLFENQTEEKKFYIRELIEISKLLEIVLNHNRKLNNILLYGFKDGWLIALLTKFCKRIYGVCQNEKQKKILEEIDIFKKHKNIYLNIGTSIFSWKKVAPFDFILSLDSSKLCSDEVTNCLSLKGLAIIPKQKTSKVIEMVGITKNDACLKIDLKYEILNKSNLI